MKRVFPGLLILFLASPIFGAEVSLTFGRFGKIALYYETPHPTNVALFVSGDGGWNLGVVDMARQLASLDALVVGIDITHYLKELAASNEECHYPASDFEELSKFVQLKLNFPSYRTPVLVGYSTGATLIYTALVQAPSNTFLGGISMGFCPDLPIAKPMCSGEGLEWTLRPKGKGYNFLPAKSLERPWIALQGTTDQVCDPKSTEIFVKKVPNGEFVILPKVGHGFSVPKNWMPQFKKAFSSIAAGGDEELAPPKPEPGGRFAPLSDLPLIEVPARDSTTNLMGVLITGDGGCAPADKGIAQSLADKGISIVGLNLDSEVGKCRSFGACIVQPS